MSFWDYVRVIVDKISPPENLVVVMVEANDVHLNPPPEQMSERAAGRLARLEAALAAGDPRQSVVDEISQIKKGGA